MSLSPRCRRAEKNPSLWANLTQLSLLSTCNTYLFLLLVEVIDDDADEQVEGEERAEDDEDDKVDVHVEVDLIRRLLFHLRATK